MSSQRVEAEAISSLKALAQKSHSILSESSPGQSKSPAPLHGWDNICVTEEREDGGHLRKTSTTISVDTVKNLNTDTVLYVHSG